MVRPMEEIGVYLLYVGMGIIINQQRADSEEARVNTVFLGRNLD